MENTPPPIQKKGLGPLAWLGIGCGGIIALLVVGFVIVTALYGGKLKEFFAEAQKNPTRVTAVSMVKMSGGQIEMVAEDDANKRYTVRDKSGKMTTIYWNQKKGAPEIIAGDFQAIPTTPDAPADAPPEAERK